MDQPALRVVDSPTVPKVLVAEDQPAMRHLLARCLREAGYDVVELQNGAALWSELNNSLADDDNPREPDLVISDIRMPGADGLDVLSRLRSAGQQTPVILITAFGTTATVLEAMRLGATMVFNKPLDVEKLVAAAIRLVPPSDEEAMAPHRELV